MSIAPHYRHVEFGVDSVIVKSNPAGHAIVTNTRALQDYPQRMTDRLRHWAQQAPERSFLAKRDREGNWRHISYGQALQEARRIAQALLDRGLSTERPVLILSQLGSVLGHPDPALIAMVQSHLDAGDAAPPVAAAAQAFRRTDLDRDWLGAVLRAGPRRLMYVGHVSQSPVAAGQSEDAQLHLCCDAQTDGLAEPVRRHRPLSAKDLFLGTLAARADGVPGALIWSAPPRVALIACESGGDLRFAESFGLASATGSGCKRAGTPGSRAFWRNGRTAPRWLHGRC